MSENDCLENHLRGYAEKQNTAEDRQRKDEPRQVDTSMQREDCSREHWSRAQHRLIATSSTGGITYVAVGTEKMNGFTVRAARSGSEID
jgi:hypothetical protein